MDTDGIAEDEEAQEARIADNKQNICNICLFVPKKTVDHLITEQNKVLDKYYNVKSKVAQSPGFPQSNNKSGFNVNFVSNLKDILLVCRMDGHMRIFNQESMQQPVKNPTKSSQSKLNLQQQINRQSINRLQQSSPSFDQYPAPQHPHLPQTSRV